MCLHACVRERERKVKRGKERKRIFISIRNWSITIDIRMWGEREKENWFIHSFIEWGGTNWLALLLCSEKIVTKLAQTYPLFTNLAISCCGLDPPMIKSALNCEKCFRKWVTTSLIWKASSRVGVRIMAPTCITHTGMYTMCSNTWKQSMTGRHKDIQLVLQEY